MSKFTFDGAEHDLDALPQEARSYVNALQFLDAELNRHLMEQATLQTAKIVYANALRETIAKQGMGIGNGMHDSSPA